MNRPATARAFRRALAVGRLVRELLPLSFVVVLLLPSPGAHAAWQDAANPVFSPVGGVYYPAVVRDADRFSGHGAAWGFKMWYSNGGATEVGLAGSNDGVSWTVLSPSVAGLTAPHHVQVVFDPGGFGGSGHFYRIWYWDQSTSIYGIGAIRTAVSSDGVTWSGDQAISQVGSSVVTGTWPDWNYGSYGPIAVIFDPAGAAALDDGAPFANRFVMYYDGTTGAQEAWGLAYSVDGVLWKGYGGGASALLPAGGSGKWDANYAAHGSVVRNPDGSFELWYSGGVAASSEGIGHATSPDGIAWTRDSTNPLVDLGCPATSSPRGCAGSWNETRNYAPAVLRWPFDGACPSAELRMWRSGRSASGTKAVGLATLPVPSGTVRAVPGTYATIQAAIAAADPGDTVRIAAGSYSENVVVDKAIALAGAGAGSTILRSASSAVDPSAVVWIKGTESAPLGCVSIDGLTIDGRKGEAEQVTWAIYAGDDLFAEDAGLFYCDPGHCDAGSVPWYLTVSNVRLSNLVVRDASRCGALFHKCRGVEVDSCTIRDNDLVDGAFHSQLMALASKRIDLHDSSISTADTAAGNAEAGISLLGEGRVSFESFRIERNTIAGSNGGGGALIRVDGDGDLAADPAARVVSGNLLDGLGLGARGILLRNGILGVTVATNTIRGNLVNVALAGPAGSPADPILVRNNTIAGDSAPGASTGIWLNVDGSGLETAALVTGNRITGHSNAGVLVDGTGGSTASILLGGSTANANDLDNFCGDNLRLVGYGGSVAAPNNYWGTTCAGLVASSIVDGSDLAGLGTVSYGPWLDSTHAILYPPAVDGGCPWPGSAAGASVSPDTTGSASALTLTFALTAARAESTGIAFELDPAFTVAGFPVGTAGSWSDGASAPHAIVGTGSGSAYVDLDDSGTVGAGDLPVTLAGRRFEIVRPSAAPHLESSSRNVSIVLASGVVTNPASAGLYPLRLEFDSYYCQQSVGSASIAIGDTPDASCGGWHERGRVFRDPAGAAYYPAVRYDPSSFSGHGAAAKYKMWYSGTGGIRLATSDDGIDWTVAGVVSGLANPHHARVLYDSAGFGGGAYYRIYYWNTAELYSIAAIRTALSADGLAWISDQPISQVGSTVVDGASAVWNRGSYGPVDVLFDPAGSPTLDDANPLGNRWVLYYDGTTGGVEAIGLAYSADGLVFKGWNGGVAPVLDIEGGTAWDSSYATTGSVLHAPGGAWEMWYSGGSTAAHQGIGYAESADGIHWTRCLGNPIASLGGGANSGGLGLPGSFNEVRHYTPAVLFDAAGFGEGSGCASRYKMWRTGQDAGGVRGIGYAVTEDVPAGFSIGSATASASPGNAGLDAAQILVWENPRYSSRTVQATVTFPSSYTVRPFSADADGILGSWEEDRPFDGTFSPTSSWAIRRLGASTAYLDVDGDSLFDPGVDGELSLSGNVFTFTLTGAGGSGTMEEVPGAVRLTLQGSLFGNPTDALSWPASYDVALGLTGLCGLPKSKSVPVTIGAPLPACRPTEETPTILGFKNGDGTARFEWGAFVPSDLCFDRYSVWAQPGSVPLDPLWSGFLRADELELDGDRTNPTFRFGLVESGDLTYFLVVEAGPSDEPGPNIVPVGGS